MAALHDGLPAGRCVWKPAGAKRHGGKLWLQHKESAADCTPCLSCKGKTANIQNIIRIDKIYNCCYCAYISLYRRLNDNGDVYVLNHRG
jgi:hypothetical protein